MKFDRSTWSEIKEIASKHGAPARLDEQRRHPMIIFIKGDRSRFITASRTPSDHRVRLNKIKDARRALAELDAQPALSNLRQSEGNRPDTHFPSHHIKERTGDILS